MNVLSTVVIIIITCKSLHLQAWDTSIMETSCLAQHNTHLSWLTSTGHCCSTCNLDQHFGCRYHLVLNPIIKVVHHALPETTRKTTKTDLHYCDLQWLPLDAVLCMCDWLKLAVDLFSKTTGAMLLQDGLDDEDMQVISQACVWPCQAAARAAHHCFLYTFSLPCISFSSVSVDHALRAASRRHANCISVASSIQNAACGICMCNNNTPV